MRLVCGFLLALCLSCLVPGMVRGIFAATPGEAVEAHPPGPWSNAAIERPAPDHPSRPHPEDVERTQAEEEDTESSKVSPAALTAGLGRPLPPGAIGLTARAIGIDGSRRSVRSPLLRC